MPSNVAIAIDNRKAHTAKSLLDTETAAVQYEKTDTVLHDLAAPMLLSLQSRVATLPSWAQMPGVQLCHQASIVSASLHAKVMDSLLTCQSKMRRLVWSDLEGKQGQRGVLNGSIDCGHTLAPVM